MVSDGNCIDARISDYNVYNHTSKCHSNNNESVY